MRILKRIFLFVLAALAMAYAYLRVAPPELLQVGSGYAAKTICSNVFIANRKAEDVLRDDVQAPGHPILKAMRMSVDESAAVVRAALIGNIAAAKAVYRPGFGCSLVPGGETATPSALARPAAPTPAHVWREEMDARINPILDDAAMTGPGMRAVVVVRNGAIIGERYAEGFTPQTPLLGWSMTKTVTAMLVGELVKQGKLDPASTGLFAPWAGDERAKISLADLLAMESGLKWNEGYGDVSDVTRMLFLTADMKSLPESQPAESAPGEAFVYSSGTSLLVSQLIEEAVGAGAEGFARSALFNPLGMASAVIEPDASGTLAGSSYMYATGRDWARLGQFMIAGGVAGGKALLPSGWTQMMTTPTAASKGAYGKGHVWLDDVDDNGAPTGLPKGTFRFSGHDGQSVTVVPSERLIIVRLGLTPSRLGWEPQPMTKSILAALKG
jgi:CubicO group peptidase (beta-lactamase class C family)